jgi:hypothetical protein
MTVLKMGFGCGNEIAGRSYIVRPAFIRALKGETNRAGGPNVLNLQYLELISRWTPERHSILKDLDQAGFCPVEKRRDEGCGYHQSEVPIDGIQGDCHEKSFLKNFAEYCLPNDGEPDKGTLAKVTRALEEERGSREVSDSQFWGTVPSALWGDRYQPEFLNFLDKVVERLWDSLFIKNRGIRYLGFEMSSLRNGLMVASFDYRESWRSMLAISYDRRERFGIDNPPLTDEQLKVSLRRNTVALSLHHYCDNFRLYAGDPDGYCYTVDLMQASSLNQWLQRSGESNVASVRYLESLHCHLISFREKDT